MQLPSTSRKSKPTSGRGRPERASITGLLLLAAALVAAPTRTPAQSIVVFGDSSADLGSQGPDRRPTNLGEMWSETLAKRIGTTLGFARSLTYDASGDLVGNTFTGGSSYAINGSTASRFDGVFTLSDQVEFFIDDRAMFGADDLVFVWITRNDITTAFSEGSVYDPQIYADDYIEAINSMQAAGARNIIAFGAETKLLPAQLLLDSGFTQGQIDDLGGASKASDDALWPMLKHKNVYIIDTDRLAEDVRLDPVKYGFAFATDSYQGRGDASGALSQSRPNDGNVFTEDGHYTSAMQLIISDFALAQVRARDQYRTNLLQTGYRFRSNLASVDHSRLMGQGNEPDEWRVYGGTGFESSQAGGDLMADVALKQKGFDGHIGADHKSENGFLIGGRVDLGTASGDFEDGAGRVDQESVQISGYLSKQLASGFHIHATTSGGAVRFNSITRSSDLGNSVKETAKGQTKAQYQMAAVGFGKTTRLGGAFLTGELQVATEKTRISGYRESSDVLALSYGESDFSSELLSVGFHFERESAPGRINPFASLKWTHDFGSETVKVRLGPTDATIVDYVTDRPFSDEVNFQIGANYLMGSGLLVQGAVTSTQYSGGSAGWGTVGLALNLSKRL